MSRRAVHDGRSELSLSPRPIIIIGAGGIVREAHLPAYRKANFNVFGIYDLEAEKAEALAQSYSIPHVYTSLDGLTRAAPPGAVFDVAVPAPAVQAILSKLPAGSAVLIQKPMGEELGAARVIRNLCRRRKLVAAVNFQLRFAPHVIIARRIVEEGRIGELNDLEVRVTVNTPWHLWDFLASAPRVEILYHSIHYIDLIRSFWGDPVGVYAKTVKHPSASNLAPTRSTIILDYGEMKRATITTNHHHIFGTRHQESYIKWEGDRGAIKATLGVNLNYPAGMPDALEYCSIAETGEMGEWESVAFEGGWFPDAFIGTMSSLMRFLEGPEKTLPTSVEDAFRTMAVVEAAYRSSANGRTEVPR